ncbi:GNAT family N-acetyltransferase [Vibrio sp. 16]|uniref:GNAT family N-acetyltransferase n=1 Tax=Vibrio sp. 16 TaxID=391586 RepID=UPI002FEE907C
MLSTQHLILKPATEGDLDIFLEILGSDALTKYLPKGSAYTEDEIKLYTEKRLAHWQHGYGTYIIYEKAEPNIKIGYVGVEQCADPRFSDVRYAILPRYQGKGYVFEAASAVISETFKTQALDKIYGVALKQNLASLAIIKKLGMTADPNTGLYGEFDDLETYSVAR